MPRVEIRLPTFRRPNLLRRALVSLQQQTHRDWICRVFDDDPGEGGRKVCEALGDSRVRYEPNSFNMGICKNIDLSFSAEPLAGTDFLCVLEDDNFYKEDNLLENIVEIEGSGLDVLLRNQSIEKMMRHDMPGEIIERTMFDGQYQAGVLSHRWLFGTFFYCTGANNSSLFWRSGVGLDFSTVQYISDDPVAQERLRTLCIDRDVVVGIRPLIVWRDNGDESLRPKLKGRRALLASQIRSAAYERAIYDALAAYLAEAGTSELAFKPQVGEFTAQRERPFVRCGLPVPRNARRLSWEQRLILSVKRVSAQAATVLVDRDRVSFFIDPVGRRLAAL